MSYSITKETKIVLYGAATMGTLYYEKYKRWGLSVIAFIDKRANEIKKFINLPVYSINNNLLNKDDVVIIIAVKNVFEHSRIAKVLYKLGYKKLIYRPYSALNNNGSKDEQKLNDIYTYLTDNNDLNIEKLNEIPVINPCTLQKLYEHGLIIKKENHVIFYLPVTMLFCDKKNEALEFQYNILCLKPHINFVKYLIGRGGESESYLNYCIKAAKNVGTVNITEAWKNNVISNRSEVFLDMLHKYNIEPEFFINKAINVIWNKEKGYFNLNSGKHRAAFLCGIGNNYIPVKATKADYDSYLNFVDYLQIANKITQYDEDGYSIPYENPMLYEFSRYSENFWFLLIRNIIDYINKWYYNDCGIFERLKVLNNFQDGLYINTFFERMGFCINKEKKIIYDVAILDKFEEINKINSKYYFIISKENSNFENFNLHIIANLRLHEENFYLYVRE